MRAYRLRIRDAADTTWESTYTAFFKPPQVGGQRVYPLQGKTTSKPWICEIVDDSEDLTGALAESIDTHWRYTLLQRKSDVSEADDSGAYTVLATGQITDISLGENQGTYRISLQDQRAVERQTDIFTYSNTTTVWPPDTTLDGGFYEHRNKVRLRVTEWNYTSPVSAIRFENNNINTWPESVRKAINDDLTVVKTNVSPSSVSEGSFDNLRLRVGGNDYEVIAFAYMVDDLTIGSTIPVGSRPAHDDNAVGCFVFDTAHALSGTSQASAYFYFPKRTDDDGYWVGYAPSEDVPLHVEGQVFDILQQIYDGDFGGEPVAYDSTQMSALQADGRFPPGVAYRITRGPTNMAKWVEANIYKPFLCVPLTNSVGEVFPQPLLLPSASDVPDVSALTQLGTGNVTKPITWRNDANDQITRITFNAESRLTTSGLTDGSGISAQYDGSLDRWAPRRFPSPHSDRVDDFGLHDFALDIPTIYPTDGTPENNDGSAEFAEAWAEEWLNRFVDGPIYYKAEVDRTVTEVVGDWLVINCNETKTPNAGLRSGYRLVQVIAKEVTVTGSKLELLDAGPFLNAVSAPSISITQNATEPRHKLRVSISGFGSGVKYELQMAKATETDWWNIASGTESIVDVGGLISNTLYYVRARTIAPQRIRSDWSASDSATTDAYNAPTSVTATATNNEIAVTWVNSHDLPVEVWFDTVTPFSTTTATPWETFTAGTTGCTIGGLATSTLYYISCRHRGPYGGYSPVAGASDSTGAAEGTLTAADNVYIELGSNVGTRSAP